MSSTCVQKHLLTSAFSVAFVAVLPLSLHAGPTPVDSVPTGVAERERGTPTSHEVVAPSRADGVPVPTVDEELSSQVRVDQELPEYEDPVAQALGSEVNGLTADQVALRASHYAPDIEVARAQLDVAAAKVDQAMVAFFPQLALSANYTRLSDVNVNFGEGALVGAAAEGPLSVGPCPDGASGCVVDAQGGPVFASSFIIPQVLDQFSLQATLSVPLSDYALGLVQARKAAKANERSRELARDAEVLKVQVNSRLAYYDWLRAVAQVAIAERTLADSRRRKEDAEASYAVGLIAKSDLLRLDTLVANAENAIAQSKAMEQVAAANLAILMQEPVRNYQVGEDVFEIAKEPVLAGPIEDLVDHAMNARLEVRAVIESSEALRRATKAEQVGYYPRLSAFVDGIYANPNPRFFPATKEWNGTWAAGVTLSYLINQPFMTRARVKELRANRRELEAQLEALRRGIALEVTSAHADYQRAKTTIDVVRRARQASEEAYRVAADLYHYGKNTTTDLIAAESERVNATLRDVNAHIDLRVARVRLDYATGSLVPLAGSADTSAASN